MTHVPVLRVVESLFALRGSELHGLAVERDGGEDLHGPGAVFAHHPARDALRGNPECLSNAGAKTLGVVERVAQQTLPGPTGAASHPGEQRVDRVGHQNEDSGKPAGDQLINDAADNGPVVCEKDIA